MIVTLIVTINHLVVPNQTIGLT